MAQLKPTYDKQNSCRILLASLGFQYSPAAVTTALACLARLPPAAKATGFRLGRS